MGSPVLCIGLGPGYGGGMIAVLQILVLLVAAVLSAEIFIGITGVQVPPPPATFSDRKLKDLEFPTPQPIKFSAPTPPPAPDSFKSPTSGKVISGQASPKKPKSTSPPPADLLKPIQEATKPIFLIPILTPPLMPRISDQEFYAKFSPAVIQIYCVTNSQVFSASGVIVNPRGLVLTNAHVANIVQNAGVANCQARHGNPADPFARLDVVFIADTTKKIDQTQVPQYDFAFLRLVNPIADFTDAEVGFGVIPRGETLLTLGYPSEFLESIATSNNSNLVFSLLAVDNYADIDDDPSTADVFTFNGGLVLQQGSSGTALFTREGRVAGIIFATTKAKTTAEREGLALMSSYIDRVLRLETGMGLKEFIGSH